MKKVILTVLFGFCLLNCVSAQADSNLTHTIAKQAVLIDFETGMVLYEKQAHQRMAPSSMTKSMTIYLTFKALKESKIDLSSTFKVSEKAWRKGGSKMFVNLGKRVSVEDLIRGVVVQSGNDASIVLAEGLAGSEENFANMMNYQAKKLGMTKSQFKNASGWPEEGHYTTAYDMGILGVALVREFKNYYHYHSEQEFTFNDIKQRNRNPLLYLDIGADGIKTGHTEAGGYGLIASGEQLGRRVVLVVNGLPDKKARAQESARLLEWGLKGFENKTLLNSGDVVVDVPVVLGEQESVPLYIKDKVRVTLQTGKLDEIKADVTFTGPLKAPVKGDVEAGVLKITLPRGDVLEYKLYTKDSVRSLGFVASTVRKLKLRLNGEG